MMLGSYLSILYMFSEGITDGLKEQTYNFIGSGIGAENEGETQKGKESNGSELHLVLEANN